MAIETQRQTVCKKLRITAARNKMFCSLGTDFALFYISLVEKGQPIYGYPYLCFPIFLFFFFNICLQEEEKIGICVDRFVVVLAVLR